MDLSKLSTKDLVALRDNDLSRISTDGLQFLKSQYSNKQEEPVPEAPVEPPTTGFTGALESSYEKMKGEGALLAGKVGLMKSSEAEAYQKGQEEKSKRFKPTEEGWTQAPVTKFKELLGGSLPYMAAPIVVGGAAALAAPELAIAGIGAGALGAFGASATQFTASNLARQMESGKNLQDTSLLAAGATAIPQAALDALSFKMMPGIRQILGSAGIQLTEKSAKELAERGILSTLGEYTVQGAKVSGIEGGTEAAQQFLERLQAGLNLTDEAARKEYYDSFLGGAILGGVIGGAGHAVEKLTAKPLATKGIDVLPQAAEAPQLDPEQYKTALAGLQGVIPVGGTTDSAKLTETLSGMGIQNPEEYLNQVKATGDIKSYTTPFFDVQNASGNVLFRSSNEAIANNAAERLNAQQPQSASVVPGEVTRYAHANDLVDGAEIVKGQFKPESTTFDLSAGDTPLSKGLTAEDAEVKAQRLTELRNKKAASFDAEIKKNQDSIDKNTLGLETAEADGKAGTPEYEALDKQVKENNALIQPKIDELQLAKKAYSEPVMVTQSRPEAISEDGFTVFKDNKPVQHFATEELARTAVSGATSVDQAADQQPTDSTTPEAKAAVAALRERLLPFMKRLNLDGSMLKILDSIESGQGAGDGYYANQVIAVALNAANPMGTLRHETIHALKALGAFKPNEWRVLEERAKSEWIDKFIRQRTVEGGRNMYEAYKALYQQNNKGSLVGFDAYITEEAIADAFKYFNQTKPPVGLIGNIYNRIEKFFAEIKSALNGQGIETAEQIFTRVEAGQMRPTAAPTGNAPRYDIVSLEDKRKDIFTDPDTLEAWKAIGRNDFTQPVAERFSTRSRDEAERKIYKKYLTKKDILEAARIQGDVKPSSTTEEGIAGIQYIQKLLYARSNDRYLDEIKELKKAGPTEMGRAQEAFGETAEDNRTDAQKARDTMAYNRERVEFLKKTPEELQDLAAQHAYGVAYSNQAEAYQEAKAEGVTLSDKELEQIRDNSYQSEYKKELTRLQNRQEKLWSERKAPRYDLSKKPTKVMTMADLGKVIPASERVVSKKPGRLLNGKKFSNADLKNVGEGFLVYKNYGESDAEGRVKNIWEESIADVENFVSGSREGAFIKDLVKSLGAKPPTAKFLNDSLSLPDSARYWYETSAEAVDQTTLNTKNKDLLINIISATSQNVPPLPNMRRGISVISEYFQNKPIETDLISKKPVADAISNRNIQTLKFGNFADTMKFINGYTKNPPVSTNDRQVAAIFNMEPDEFAKNPVLYAVVSKFYAKIRDSQNEMQGKGKQPYESWQIQALNWVEERGDNTSYGKKTADSYDQAIEVITEQLKKAGIPLDKGKIGMATLKDPRVPNLLSGTMDVFQESVKATVESNTLLNKAGSEANQEYEKIKNINEPWARNLRTEFLMIQTRVLKKLSSSKLIEQVAKLATGQNVKAFAMSRMDANARGTFEGKLSPNIRIPMFYRKGETKTLITDAETDFILSVIGSGLDQAAMAGSLFKPDVKGETFRVFLPDRKITDDEATTFEKNVGFPLNLYDVPNGAVVEINIGGYDTRPTAASVRAALSATFGNNVNAKLAKASYKSTYLTKEKVEYAPSYREVIYDYRDSKFGRGNKNGFRRPFDDSLAKIGKSLIAIANERDGQFEEFTKESKTKRAGYKAYKQKIGSKTDWAVMGGPSGGKYQLTAARIDVDGVMRPTRNNKGSPIAATTEAVKNFWRWFGNSGVVDEKGYPRLVLHGTARDFEVFTPKQAGAIFFTDDPKFADTYSKQLSPNWMVDHYRDFLTAEQIESAKAETLRVMDNLTREEYRLTQKSSPEEFAEIYEWELAVKSRLPSGPNTMPIYVKMENPFDYENKSHVEAVVDKLLGSKKSIKFDQDVRALPPNPLSRDDLIRIIHGDKSKEGKAARGGFWSLIENNQVVATIQSLGFDGLSMWEDGVKNYAVFKPTQVKSAVGNLGTFDPTNPDIRYSLREKADELKAMSESKRDNLDVFDFGFSAYVLYEAEKMMPKKDGAFKSVNSNNSFSLHQEADAVVNVNDKPFLAVKEEDPDNENEIVWYFYDPEDGGRNKGISTDFSEKTEAVAQLKQKLKENEEKQVKYSLRDDIRNSMGQGHLDAVDRITTKRVNATLANRMASAISSDGRTAFRQRYLNKYESIERLSKRIAGSVGQGFRGQAELLADTSAIAATLQSDRASGVAAEAFVSGIPVYKNGFTKVSDLNGRVKGLIPIFEPLMKYKDPLIFQMFQLYAATKRGSRLMQKGILTPLTQADLRIGADFAVKFPEFVTVFNDYQEFNKGLVRFLIDTGVLTKSMGDEFMKYSDYIPFYRQLEGQDTVGPKLFNSLSGVRPPHKMKGGDAPLADFMETVVRNARAAIESGMKNVASQRIARDVMRLNSPNAPYAQRLNNHPGGFDVIKVRENGIDVSYRVADPLLVEAMSSMHNVGLGPLWQMAAYPTKLLRNLVTKDPGFMLANLVRDSMQAWSTSGTSMVPIVDTFKQFAKVLANQSPEARALKAAGIGAGYEFAGDIKASTEAVQEILRKRTGNLTSAEKAMLPLSKIWDALEKGSNASDLATRAEIYKKTMERTGGNEAEAMYQALEVMNFGRMGNSPMIQVISALVPFFNARVQGLDVLFRSAGGYSSMFGTMASENNATQQKAFIVRTMTILGLSMMYYMLASDSDEYKRASPEVRDNNWIIGKVKIPIPFEIGVLFKVMPERIAAYYFGNDTGKDLQASVIRNIVSTLKINPVPQIALPLVELGANHSFFTGEDITPKSMEHVAPQFQERSGTSEWAKKLSAAISAFAPDKMKLSPIQIDYLLSGYTGTMGTYAGLLVDSIINTAEGKTKPSMSIEQTPVLKRFFASDKSGGTMTAFYDLKEQVDEVTRTSKLLLERGSVDEYRSYMQDKGKLLALKPLTENIDTKLSQLRKLRNMVNFSKMGSDEKRQTLDNIRMAEIRMTEQIQGLKKRFAQM